MYIIFESKNDLFIFLQRYIGIFMCVNEFYWYFHHEVDYQPNENCTYRIWLNGLFIFLCSNIRLKKKLSKHCCFGDEVYLNSYWNQIINYISWKKKNS